MFVSSAVLDPDCKTALAGWTGNTKTTHHVYTRMQEPNSEWWLKKMDLKSLFAHPKARADTL